MSKLSNGGAPKTQKIKNEGGNQMNVIDQYKNAKDKKVLITSMNKGQLKIGKGTGNINVWETYNLSKILENEGFNVTIASTVDTDIAVAYDKLDVNSFDKVIVMNALVDFPGGEENKPIDALFKFLKPYKGIIYNLLVDLAIPFKQLYPLVRNKKWNKYASPEEINLDNEFIILSQTLNLEEVRRIYKDSDIKIKAINYVPINEWILHSKSVNFVENTGDVDLILGTSFRNGRRTQKYTDYFLNRKNINVELFGSIKESHFKNTKVKDNVKFTPKLKDVSKVIEKNSTGLATVITGDKNYNDNIITLRVGESWLGNVVTFIDQEFDSKCTIYPGQPFFYVKNGDELEKKILILKERPEYRKRMLEIQHQKVEETRRNNFPKILRDVLLED